MLLLSLFLFFYVYSCQKRTNLIENLPLCYWKIARVEIQNLGRIFSPNRIPFNMTHGLNIAC